MCISRFCLVFDYHWPHNMGACCTAKAECSTGTSVAALGAMCANGAVIGAGGGRARGIGGKGLGKEGLGLGEGFSWAERDSREGGCFPVCLDDTLNLSASLQQHRQACPSYQASDGHSSSYIICAVAYSA